MSFLLDTNILSAHLRRPASIAHRLQQHTGRLYISSLALGEIYGLLYRAKASRRKVALFDELRGELQVLSFDESCAEHFGRIRALLLDRGIVVPAIDLCIASVALAHDFTLVTNNTTDFQAIPDLRLEDWLTAA